MIELDEKIDRPETIKFLNNFIPNHNFNHLNESYLKQLRATLNYGLDGISTITASAIHNNILEDLLNKGYDIKTIDYDYELESTDFTGRMIIRGDKDGEQIITITAPPNENFIGRVITIRKTNGENHELKLKTVDGVSITPADITPLRRIGSAVSLVYLGLNQWDVFGELP